MGRRLSILPLREHRLAGKRSAWKTGKGQLSDFVDLPVNRTAAA
jgi:hypothetical protein